LKKDFLDESKFNLFGSDEQHICLIVNRHSIDTDGHSIPVKYDGGSVIV